MKKTPLLIEIIGLTSMIFVTGCSKQAAKTSNNTTTSIVEVNQTMSKIKKEYNDFITDLSNFPCSFVYNHHYFKGFDPRFFKEESRTQKEARNGIETTIVLSYEQLIVTIVSGFYEKYNAYDYTIYLSNASSKNSGIIEEFRNLDVKIKGDSPVLKGILGDHGGSYAPYEKDLTKENVIFKNNLGRATHETFPYFNLENENGGFMFSVGWCGTWNANFSYDELNKETSVYASGTNDMKTYLKPNEKIRSALIGVVRYYERDEDIATNSWRKWMIDCNLPRDNNSEIEHIKPILLASFATDSDRPMSDGSIAEYYGSWKNSHDSFYEHGLECDVRWFDAGWYFDPYKQTVPSDWWGTVGTWDLDKTKWPGTSFSQMVDDAHNHGSNFMVWFEAERVTHLDGLVANYGYKREWALAVDGNRNDIINNLGNPAALDWTTNRILSFFENYDIDLYREDFNIEPAPFWEVNDVSEGKNRKGITENLYCQGHYALWDSIIDYCARNGKCKFVDSCASGGGRNDLESVRRSVPFLRSDSDRTTIPLRLSFTQSLTKWLPYTGAASNDAQAQLADGVTDKYSFRASFLASTYITGQYYYNRDHYNFEEVKNGIKEFRQFSPYVFYDFYNLTPYCGLNNDKSWVSYMYFDNDLNKGALEAFRQANCEEESIVLKLKGVKDNCYYSITDIDGVNSFKRVKGSALKRGLPIVADSKRTAIVIYIDPVE